MNGKIHLECAQLSKTNAKNKAILASFQHRFQDRQLYSSKVVPYRISADITLVSRASGTR
jgi:hypothetical protein